MEMRLRIEQQNDYEQVESVIAAAFQKQDEIPPEVALVQRLRTSNAFIPELSIVVQVDNDIIAHILYTKVSVVAEDHEYTALALAPVAVHPKFQGQGIGSYLIKETLQRTETYSAVIVLGHAQYYPRFGFTKASIHNIYPPFDVPDEVFMVVVNDPAVNGTVQYDAAFDI